MSHRAIFLVLVLSFIFNAASLAQNGADVATAAKTLPTEELSGEGIWMMPALQQQVRQTSRVTVWFEDQFLGDGESYRRRASTYANWKRRELRAAVVATLKALNDKSYAAARESLDALVEGRSDLQPSASLGREWL